MEENKNTFQVVITHQPGIDQDKHLVIRKLAALFKIDEAKAALLLTKPESIIKDNIDEATANKYLAAVQKTGAHCQIINKAAEQELPDIIEPIKPEAPQFIRHTEHSEAPEKVRDLEMALVEREKKQEKETREKLSSLQNFHSEAFCPQCGTIRSNEHAVCLHCGYDPGAKNTSTGTFKKLVYVLVALFSLIALTMFAGLPFYQQYTLKSRIASGLQLAFDTRNQVAEFIERTRFWPNQNIDAGLAKHISNDVIESIVITDKSVMTVTLKAEITGASNQTIIFTPALLKGKLVWNCTHGTLSNDYRPPICKQAN
ncbi:MAG: hypothetical protein EP315_03005 [Gammaproteobacteria bacterium]|nr:MAG: hypothetical protein EP315_03005 [Gammaproteobacteria bacterium]